MLSCSGQLGSVRRYDQGGALRGLKHRRQAREDRSRGAANRLSSKGTIRKASDDSRDHLTPPGGNPTRSRGAKTKRIFAVEILSLWQHQLMQKMPEKRSAEFGGFVLSRSDLARLFNELEIAIGKPDFQVGNLKIEDVAELKSVDIDRVECVAADVRADNAYLSLSIYPELASVSVRDARDPKFFAAFVRACEALKQKRHWSGKYGWKKKALPLFGALVTGWLATGLYGVIGSMIGLVLVMICTVVLMLWPDRRYVRLREDAGPGFFVRRRDDLILSTISFFAGILLTLVGEYLKQKLFGGSAP